MGRGLPGYTGEGNPLLEKGGSGRGQACGGLGAALLSECKGPEAGAWSRCGK